MNTREEIQSAAVELLHFHPKWFAFGMLPLDFFEQQVKKFRKVQHCQEQDDAFWENPDPQLGEDLFWASLEHHRYAAFQTTISTHKHFSDTELEQYITSVAGLELEVCEVEERLSCPVHAEVESGCCVLQAGAH